MVFHAFCGLLYRFYLGANKLAIENLCLEILKSVLETVRSDPL